MTLDEHLRAAAPFPAVKDPAPEKVADLANRIVSGQTSAAPVPTVSATPRALPWGVAAASTVLLVGITAVAATRTPAIPAPADPAPAATVTPASTPPALQAAPGEPTPIQLIPQIVPTGSLSAADVRRMSAVATEAMSKFAPANRAGYWLTGTQITLYVAHQPARDARDAATKQASSEGQYSVVIKDVQYSEAELSANLRQAGRQLPHELVTAIVTQNLDPRTNGYSLGVAIPPSPDTQAKYEATLGRPVTLHQQSRAVYLDG